MAKQASPLSAENVLRDAHNPVDNTIAVGNFVTSAVGNKVEMTITTTNVANDTEQYAFYNTDGLLLTLEVVYTDGTRNTFLSAERIN